MKNEKQIKERIALYNGVVEYLFYDGREEEAKRFLGYVIQLEWVLKQVV